MASVAVQINGVTYEGLKAPWPEAPDRNHRRQGATMQCIPGISGGQTVAGKRIHADLGHDESWGDVTIILQYVPESDLATIMTAYRSANPTTVTYRDPYGNVWECVYKPNTESVRPRQAPGFPNRQPVGSPEASVEAYEAIYRVEIRLNFIQRTSTGSLP